MSDKLRIIVSGLVGLYPVGGVAWDYLQYLIGFSRLGHEVYYHEDTWNWPYQPIQNQHVSTGHYSAEFINDYFKIYAPKLCDNWHYIHMREKSFGIDPGKFRNICNTADLYINVSGACFIPEYLSPKCMKVFLDTDPGYNQILLSERYDWSDNIERWSEIVSNHDQFFTYAENINGPDCIIPKLGFNWKTTRMPIVTDLWNNDSAGLFYPEAPWTTIMSWKDFKGKLIYKGKEFKSKGIEFEKILDLPRYTDASLKIAVGGAKAPLELLKKYGWEVIDGPKATLTPKRYHEFIQKSRGEISVAKQVYVDTRSGWFSCRSACYLSAGRPVITQDTGFGKFLDTGKGLFPFNTIEDVISSMETVNSNYKQNTSAAREIVESYFKAETVLNKLIEDL